MLSVAMDSFEVADIFIIFVVSISVMIHVLCGKEFSAGMSTVDCVVKLSDLYMEGKIINTRSFFNIGIYINFT